MVVVVVMVLPWLRSVPVFDRLVFLLSISLDCEDTVFFNLIFSSTLFVYLHPILNQF